MKGLQQAGMVYSTDFGKSARRHLLAANILYGQDHEDRVPCQAVAGYLFGIAGELAVKQLMRASGIQPLPAGERREDPFFCHFPELKSRLASRIQGRRAGELRTIADNQELFAGWDVSMRYAPTSEVSGKPIAKWKVSAKELVQTMEAAL